MLLDLREFETSATWIGCRDAKDTELTRAKGELTVAGCADRRARHKAFSRTAKAVASSTTTWCHRILMTETAATLHATQECIIARRTNGTVVPNNRTNGPILGRAWTTSFS